jgi:hypothetical protein
MDVIADKPDDFLRSMTLRSGKKEIRGLPDLTKNYVPKGPDTMGEPPFGLKIFHAEGPHKKVARIFRTAKAARKKAKK